MLDLKNKSSCSGCSACFNICPKKAISMVEDKEGFRYPKINKEKCINCSLCEKVCPIKNPSEEEKALPISYAAFNKNEEIRMKSSSGGIFTEIATKILEKDGVVFGAVFDKEFNVVHEEVRTTEELEKMRGSKYIQSDLKDSYAKVKQILLEGKRVLFTGTPCQIEGLYSFLGKDPENLYTQDLICHGVPSKIIWNKYLEYRKTIDKDILEKMTFRNKDIKGWSNYQVCFKYKNKEINIDHKEDMYMQIFLKDFALRPSCYECKFKKKHRKSDITLADFWGINEVCPEMNDEKGTSLVIINSAKGEQLLKSIENKIQTKEVDFELAINHNKSMIKSPDINKRKNDFISTLNFENVEFTNA